MSSDIHYVVNTEGILLATSEKSWDDFARDNDGRDLIPFPESRSLIASIGEPKLRQLYAEVIEHITNHPQRKVVIPFRVDSPEVVRGGALKATAIACAGTTLGVFFESHIVNERPRRRKVECLRRYRPIGIDWPRAEYCSHCGRIRSHQVATGWVEFDEYYGAGGTDQVQLAQAVCRPCVMSIQDRIHS